MHIVVEKDKNQSPRSKIIASRSQCLLDLKLQRRLIIYKWDPRLTSKETEDQSKSTTTIPV